MITIFGYAATFLTLYNIACGILARISSNDTRAMVYGIEAAIWFIAATVAFK